MEFEQNQSISTVRSNILTVTDDIRWWAIPTIFFDFLWFTKMNHRRLSSIINDYKKSMKFEINQSISSVFSHILTVTDDIRWWAIAIRFLSLLSIIINYHNLISSIIIDYHQLSSIIINYHQLSSIIIDYDNKIKWTLFGVATYQKRIFSKFILRVRFAFLPYQVKITLCQFWNIILVFSKSDLTS